MKRINRELKYAARILDIYEDTMQAENGNIEYWDFVKHRMGAAAILPVLPDGRVILVSQYRNAVEQDLLELPAGCRDSLDEDYAVCAARELEEETGYKAGKLELLLSICSSPAILSEQINIYLATDLIPSQQHLDENEELGLSFLPFEEAVEMVKRGEMHDAKAIAAIMTYAVMRRDGK